MKTITLKERCTEIKRKNKEEELKRNRIRKQNLAYTKDILDKDNTLLNDILLQEIILFVEEVAKNEKDVFSTAFRMPLRYLLDALADRNKVIADSISNDTDYKATLASLDMICRERIKGCIEEISKEPVLEDVILTGVYSISEFCIVMDINFSAWFNDIKEAELEIEKQWFYNLDKEED